MMRFRAFFFAALISLPALLVVGFGSAYVVLNVPKWEKSEDLRIKREYREVAEELVDHPERGEVFGSRCSRREASRRSSGVCAISSCGRSK